MRSVRLSNLAESDLLAGCQFYQQRQDGRGRYFSLAVDADGLAA